MPSKPTSPLDTATVLATLKEAGQENTAAIYRRHGATGDVWGVPYAVVRELQKRLKNNHEVALELWATEAHEPRVVALKAMDAREVSRPQLERWLKATQDPILRGEFSDLACRRDDSLELASRWVDGKGEALRATGWGIYARLAMAERLDLEAAEALLVRIEETIHSAFNRERYSMNNALIAIGGTLIPLRKRATAAAAAIGKVEVDHGDTACRTPVAIPYMKKMWARQDAPKKAGPKSKAKPRGGKASS